MEQQDNRQESQEEREQRLSDEAVTTIRQTRSFTSEALWNSSLYGWRYPSNTTVKGDEYCKMGAHILSLVDSKHQGLLTNIEYFLHYVPSTKILHLTERDISQATANTFKPMNTDIEVVSGLTGKLSLFNGMLMCLCRCVNYTVEDSGSYSGAVNNRYCTENWLMFVSPKQSSADNDSIVLPYRLQGQREEWDWVVRMGGGLEDMRLVDYTMNDDVLEITALGCKALTVNDVSRVIMHRTILHFDGITVKTISTVPIDYGREQEKNWIPIGNNKVIYSYNPLTVLTINDDCSVSEDVIKQPTILLEQLHLPGGSRVMTIHGRKITVIHQYGNTRVNGYNRRFYFNRFVELDDQYSIIGISRPLSFIEGRSNPTEYILGATVDDSDVILTVNIGDREVTFCRIESMVVLSLVKTVEDWKNLFLIDYVG